MAAAALDVEVDAVERRLPERPRGGGAAQEVVPDVGGDFPGVVCGGETVAPGAATDGEKHLDAEALAFDDVGAEAGASVGKGVTVAGEVENGRPAVAEGGEEGEVDKAVVAGGAGGGEGALVAVLSPVDGDAAGVRPGEGGEEDEGAEEEEVCRHGRGKVDR